MPTPLERETTRLERELRESQKATSDAEFKRSIVRVAVAVGVSVAAFLLLIVVSRARG